MTEAECYLHPYACRTRFCSCMALLFEGVDGCAEVPQHSLLLLDACLRSLAGVRELSILMLSIAFLEFLQVFLVQLVEDCLHRPGSLFHLCGLRQVAVQELSPLLCQRCFSMCFHSSGGAMAVSVLLLGVVVHVLLCSAWRANSALRGGAASNSCYSNSER